MKILRTFVFCLIIINNLLAQTGPGGIGNSDGNSGQPGNILWLKADGVTNLNDGDPVPLWSDLSGNSNHAFQDTVSRRPIFKTNIINGFPVLRFDGSDSAGGDFYRVADADNLDNTDGLSVFALVYPRNLDDYPRGLFSKRIDSDLTYVYGQYWHYNWLYTDIRYSTYDRFNSNLLFSNNTWYLTELLYNGNLPVNERVKLYINTVLDKIAPEGSTSIPASTADLTIGYLNNVAGGYTFGGDMAEFIIYRSELNVAQRVILENYFSAKYNLTASNDIYAGDTPANGNYDYAVIGIGKDSTGSHTAAEGEGLALSNNAFLVDDGDYVIAGHNVGSNTYTFADVASPIYRRWSRIWYIDRTDGAASNNGNLTIAFDFSDSQIGAPPTTSEDDYGLLYRSATSGNFTVLAATNVTMTGDRISFEIAEANLTDGYFTLGLMNQPPEVANAIDDVTVAEDAVNTVIDLTDVFSDPENDPITKTVQANSNPGLVNATISGNTLTLDYQLDQFGTANITIRGTAAGQFVDDQFVVTVTAVNDPPVVANAIEDVTVAEDAVNTVIDLTDVFSDVENDPITKTVQANSNTTLVSATISGNTLTLDYQPDQFGTANITIRGTAAGQFVDDQFVVTVTAVNDPPIVANEIDDVTVAEDAPNTVIDLTDVFSDVENDPITKTVQANSNPTLVSATISGNTLTLDYQPDKFGTANITIRGTAAGQFVDDVFQVTVTAVNDPPIVANPIEDVTVAEDAPNTVIDLTDVFSDVDNDPAQINKAVQQNNNPTLVTATITNGNTLTLDYQPNQNGVATIAIRGTSGGQFIDDVFQVTVTSINDPPVVVNPINDVTVAEDAANTLIDLSDVFSDVENDPIIKTVQANSNPTLVSATISGNTLTLDYQPDQFGTANITIRGTAAGQFIDDVFQVTVTAVNDPPVVANAIEDVTVAEDAPNTVIDLTDVFSDAENDPITKTVQANSNTTLVSATVSGNTLTLDYQPNQSGTANITIRGTAAGQFVDDVFQVTVNSVNDPPIVANAIDDVTVAEDAPNTVIDLTDVFSDVENDPITKTVQANSNTTLVSATISGNTLTLDYQPDKFGTANITIRGTAAGQFVDDVFQVTVTAVNDPPIVANAIEDVTVAEDAPNTVIDLADVFSDVENDPITKTVQANSNTTLVSATISGNTLTLDYQPNQSGTANITIRGTAAGQFADDVFQVTVTAVNDPPVVANAIEDVTVAEDAPNTVINLTDVFSDAENDPITMTVQANSNPSLVNATISGDTLTLDYQPDKSGTANITIRGTAAGQFVDDVFQVTVTAVNDPPVVANAIDDVTVAEDAPNTVIDLTDVFSDVENDPITKTVQTNNNTNLVSATISGNTLTLDYQPDQFGTANITIRGTAAGEFVDDVFQVTVTAVNDPPVALNDAIATDEDKSVTIPILANDQDPDNNILSNSVSIIDSSLNGSITVNTIEGDITYQPDSDFFGADSFTYTVADDSGAISNKAMVRITVDAVNDPPVISPFPQFSFYEDDSLSNNIFDFLEYVSDPDTPDSLLSFSYRNGKHVQAKIIAWEVILKSDLNWNGRDTLNLRVSDGEMMDSTDIFVLVHPMNDAPEFVNLPDTLKIVNTSSTQLVMKDYLQDVDLPDDQHTWVFGVSDDTVKYEFDDATTTLTIQNESFIGIVELYITVTDDSMASAMDTIMLDIKNDPTGLSEMYSNIPDKHILYQNYPNPFNPLTKIKFGLPKAEDVVVDIYNVLGQKVMQLYAGPKSAGYHIIEFNAGSLPSGIYFYRMETKSFQKVSKMVLLK